MPLPLGEVAECNECLKGRSTRENILPLPLGEVAERSEDGAGVSDRLVRDLGRSGVPYTI